MSLGNISIKVAPISNRIVLARFGKDQNVALETKDAMNEFLQALVQYAFDGRMPDKGDSVAVSFGGGDEHFTLKVTRTRTIRPRVARARSVVEPKAECAECHGTGEVFGHTDDCHDDLCALNGDAHSCSGKVEPCACTPPLPSLTKEINQ